VLKFPYFLPFVIALIAINACVPIRGDVPVVQAADQVVYIQNKGSDTMVNLALAWAENFQKINTVDIANASRKIKDEEIELVEKTGHTPIEFTVARDAIAVIVNPQNPIEQLTLEQVSRIYRGEVNNWKELGGENRPIVRLSRETNSGTHVYFLEEVVRLGDKEDKTIFSADTLLLPSSEGIIAEVRDNPNAIGYDGLGYITQEVKVLALAQSTGGDYILPSVQTVNAATYPIARDLYMYTLDEPTGAIKEYIDWILQPQAQEIVSQLGFVPIK
jgi:phosphate transport system substrate-binding protein